MKLFSDKKNVYKYNVWSISNYKLFYNIIFVTIVLSIYYFFFCFNFLVCSF